MEITLSKNEAKNLVDNSVKNVVKEYVDADYIKEKASVGVERWVQDVIRANYTPFIEHAVEKLMKNILLSKIDNDPELFDRFVEKYKDDIIRKCGEIIVNKSLSKAYDDGFYNS